MGSSTADRIVVRGHDLSQDLIGKVSLGAMAFLELKGRLPGDRELAVFDAILVTLVEHGMTPSAIATGAMGTLAGELEITWQVIRGLAVIARDIGLVGHLQEEMQEPLATEIWTRVDAEASGGAGPAPTE